MFLDKELDVICLLQAELKHSEPLLYKSNSFCKKVSRYIKSINSFSDNSGRSVLRKSSGTMVTSPSLPRMVCRLNPATNIPITNNSPYRFGSVRAIFCLQRNFWVVRQLTSYANGLEL